MHVAVAGWLLALGPSGAQRRLRSLLCAAAPQLAPDETITLLAPAGTAVPGGIALQPIDVPAQPTWRRVLAERRLLARVLGDIGATVLDLQSLPVPPGLPCAVCLTVHDTRDLGSSRRRSRGLSRLVLRQGLRRAAHVVVPSRFTADNLRPHLGAAPPPVTVIPGAADEAFFGLVSTEPPRPYFLHIGHLEPRKNLAMLLHAMARYRALAERAAQPMAALVLAGPDHGSGAELRALATELSIDVTFTGPVAEAQLYELYAGARAVLVPSLHEGFGLPALEGLAAGKPVLVSDRGALPEVVGDVGTVLPADDPVVWARALAGCGDGGERERTRARHFSWVAAAARAIDAWRSAERAG